SDVDLTFQPKASSRFSCNKKPEPYGRATNRDRKATGLIPHHFIQTMNIQAANQSSQEAFHRADILLIQHGGMRMDIAGAHSDSGRRDADSGFMDSTGIGSALGNKKLIRDPFFLRCLNQEATHSRQGYHRPIKKADDDAFTHF